MPNLYRWQHRMIHRQIEGPGRPFHALQSIESNFRIELSMFPGCKTLTFHLLALSFMSLAHLFNNYRRVLEFNCQHSLRW